MNSLRVRLLGIILVALSSVLLTPTTSYACGVGQGDVMGCNSVVER